MEVLTGDRNRNLKLALSIVTAAVLGGGLAGPVLASPALVSDLFVVLLFLSLASIPIFLYYFLARSSLGTLLIGLYLVGTSVFLVVSQSSAGLALLWGGRTDRARRGSLSQYTTCGPSTKMRPQASR